MAMPTKSSSSPVIHQLGDQLHQVTLEKCAQTALENARLNLPSVNQSVLALRDLNWKKDHAVVVAAGPSLHRQEIADKLKRSHYEGILIATESAMSYCLRNGIVPDLVVTLDPHPKRIIRWFGDPLLSESDLANDDYYRRQDLDPAFSRDELKSNKLLRQLIDSHGPQICVAVASCASPAVVKRCIESGMHTYWFNPLLDDYDQPDSFTRQIFDLNRLPCLNTGGNVGTAASVIAHSILEMQEVALVGMDMGYYADTTFEQTQYYEELRQLLGDDRLHEAFINVESPHWDTGHFTDPTYYWYRNNFLEMAQLASCRTLNCSGGGILFGDGVEVVAFDEFLARH